jgi:hypothetical protein
MSRSEQASKPDVQAEAFDSVLMQSFFIMSNQVADSQRLLAGDTFIRESVDRAVIVTVSIGEAAQIMGFALCRGPNDLLVLRF